MHEFHLMTQVVKAVEVKLAETGEAQLSTVRLKVSVLSHLFTHDGSTLQTAFALAARGTKAEGATLEIIPLSGEAWCPRCQTDVAAIGLAGACATCGGPVLTGPAAPEIVLHELVVQE
jgi:hydrogenase nickel incorporation protein HypA/HybF